MAEMNRKAIFFSIVSILIILIFTAMTQIDVTVRESENDMSVSRTRVKTLNSMIDDMVNYYFDRLIYVAGKNAVVGLSEYYSENPSRIEDSLSDALASRVIYDAILEDGSDEINLSN